ncbi:protein shisa-5-like isoform X2 [Ctenopharyngodon idella]|uniref:protein shisa-5-like isoform X2 n=1 Tax=Ctenopharyngodon idella TaxID=7959 RepID=UPI00222E6EFD|nr:protein shisa-5-like isoform X2 [Ctenopharyngodon idella]
MASTVVVLVLLSACLFTVTFGFDDDCHSYFTSSNEYKPSISCSSRVWNQHCCGNCDHRYCCSSEYSKLSSHDQNMCTIKNSSIGVIVSAIVGLVILIIMFIVCCCCPCCCIYKMCRKPRPVMGATTTTTVISTQYPQQPVVHGSQYPPYQPIIPPQSGFGGAPGYGGKPMPTGPYQGQPYVAGPPPPYQEAGGPGYPAPYSQAAYDGGQAAYPMQPPAQPGFTHPPPPTNYSSTQPAYNPAYVEPPKTGY